ncbi:MAG: DMT family transporter [Solirubrobacterales bacterium]
MEAFAIPFLLFVGGLLALQAAANVQLSAAMASPFGASTLQLGIGAAVLAALAAVAGSLGALELLADAEPWALVGGLGSAVYITAGILLVPRLGALVAVGLFIAGQMAASLALDGFGWLGVAQDIPGLAALGGAAAVVVGTLLIVRAQTGAEALEQAARERSGWLCLGLVAGAVLPVQGAINAELNTELDAAVAVGAFSFLVATAAMALALGGILAASAPRPQLAPLRGVPWWGWLGGLCGAIYVTSVFSLIPEIGAAPVVVLTVAGQQLASVAVDRYGLLRLPRRQVSTRRLTGVALLLAGVALITLA